MNYKFTLRKFSDDFRVESEFFIRINFFFYRWAVLCNISHAYETYNQWFLQ